MVSALGLDLGRKRIGIAGCDRLGLLATGLTTLHRQTFVRDVAQLQELCQERQVEILVVGLPYTMEGEIGSQARQVQKLASRIGESLSLPIDYVDERLTSYQAEEILRQNRRSPRRDKALVDQVAATIILQQWLDQRRSH
ncbi:Holliday junction resolvase RuvX [Candidatus Synechococcus calcipolaris G9]|uniref:Putative pre-16S rRNA nuclease n=1 Tax=Candidatus Synechococcus calcipolaris G9 TaxID=1497997 RepID=A0ABT6EZY0_9SYNE|nr:Holliday junction resolvase RuvX [Candidatus Synechococcus calcipolaris]MDG2991130.1 Holliday junction resolvase RuvX [Candidatus Synechococcus calcipolaris G9]